MTTCKACTKPIPDGDIFTHPGDGATLHNSCAEYYLPSRGDLSSGIGLDSSELVLDPAPEIILTTSHGFVNEVVEAEIEIVTAECVYGMNLFSDFFSGMSDFFGGRSNTTQNALRNARKTCLAELKKEAREVGADGVIGIRLDYSEFSGKGKSMLFLVASGTAVKISKHPEE